MADEIRVEPITAEQYETLLPMIDAYQRFYEVAGIDGDRNRDFFRRFIAPSEDGLLLGAWDGDRLIGYACLYWFFSSTQAAETVLMNDLFVDPLRRGGGDRPRPDRGQPRGRPGAGRPAPGVEHRARQPHRPAALRLDRGGAIDLDQLRARRA